jgi:hypothetical protein
MFRVLKHLKHLKGLQQPPLKNARPLTQMANQDLRAVYDSVLERLEGQLLSLDQNGQAFSKQDL